MLVDQYGKPLQLFASLSTPAWVIDSALRALRASGDVLRHMNPVVLTDDRGHVVGSASSTIGSTVTAKLPLRWQVDDDD